MRNAFINSSTNSSARAKAGLAGLDARTILPFGQEVMIHDYTQTSKLKSRGITGFALTPSKESHGYLIFVPSLRKVIGTSNYAIVVHDSTSLSESSTHSVFDNLLESYHVTDADTDLQKAAVEDIPLPDVCTTVTSVIPADSANSTDFTQTIEPTIDFDSENVSSNIINDTQPDATVAIDSTIDDPNLSLHKSNSSILVKSDSNCSTTKDIHPTPANDSSSAVHDNPHPTEQYIPIDSHLLDSISEPLSPDSPNADISKRYRTTKMTLDLMLLPLI
ncbi:uncharacterized protein NDAI_0G00540 [Naumovozyma dairenensis CBS 421]|uniref:Uncharacterized protein n=1 Tax=Naumovozyma dairenensis (strain ATCC 10597 / BCRC 20456 / CBS 421 / NBRC 0211 / NRRL Y-12639) TaxID=1071378 RepID=G0WDG9_NAUDC|nr:hypothetical protein NDAI_0G00540 [Naumovozyma dairenensis CBS 421]CCD25830.2 hypothetical protein NDAI_0G00540 [Naumovozyma dairenensis CBS 421]